jgi:hypothetical protein
MTSSVASVFRAAGLEPSGVLPWGATVPSVNPGVYAVSLVAEADATDPVLPDCPIRPEAIDALLRVRPELRLDRARPSPEELAERIQAFWIADEVILYLGLAGTSLAGRLSQYYRTPLGARSPHAGGWFLKLLWNLPDLFIHWAECWEPDDAEDRMVATFCAAVSRESAARLRDPANPLPFANLRWPRGGRKNHGISGATADRGSGSLRASSEEITPRERRQPGRRSPTPQVEAIGDFLQEELRRRGMLEVPAVEAAGWLDRAGLLRDSKQRPGLPLRNLLRADRIPGQRQDTNSRWFIDRVAGP